MKKKQSPSSISGKLSQSHEFIRTGKKSEIKSRQSKSSSGQSSERSIQETSQQVVMEQAIEKASCLIELLTRENSECKQQIGDLSNQVKQLKNDKDQLSQSNTQLEQYLILCESEKEKLQRQNEELLFELEKGKLQQQDESVSKEKLLETRQKNKQLHQKIAYLTKKTSQLNSQLQRVKKQFKSLQNQNEYLLKQLKKSQMKENTFTSNITLKQTEFNQKLNTLDRTKEAFARRTHELKQLNSQLCVQIESLRKEKYNLEIIAQQSMLALDVLTQKLQTYRCLEQKIHSIYERVKLSNPQKIKTESFNREHSTFSVSQTSLKQELQQIEALVAYRFQHIQALINHIFTNLKKPEWKSHLRHLNQTQFQVQRLNNYLTQLSINNHRTSKA